MADQEKGKSQELGLIDITEILSDYLRIFRRMWAWVLIFTILGAGLSYVRARLQYQPVYTASATFTINIQREQQGVADTGSTSFFMAKDVLSVDDLKMQQTCIPQDGTYTDITYEGMQVLKVDFDANKKKIEQLLY